MLSLTRGMCVNINVDGMRIYEKLVCVSFRYQDIHIRFFFVEVCLFSDGFWWRKGVFCNLSPKSPFTRNLPI